jgi:hypothetical protein
MPQPPRHWNLGRRDVVPHGPRTLPPTLPWSLGMSGVITSVKPVFRKPTEPDPRLARLADRIKQVRHAQALRLRRPAGRSEDLH